MVAERELQPVPQAADESGDDEADAASADGDDGEADAVSADGRIVDEAPRCHLRQPSYAQMLSAAAVLVGLRLLAAGPRADAECALCGEEGCWPTAFLIGAPKAATTSLWSALSTSTCGATIPPNAECCRGRSPGADLKEVYFFDGEVFPPAGRAARSYQQLFAATCESGKDVRADGSVTYLLHWQAPQRMVRRRPLPSQRALPHSPSWLWLPAKRAEWTAGASSQAETLSACARAAARFVVVLREPIARDLSMYNQMVRRDRGSQSTSARVTCGGGHSSHRCRRISPAVCSTRTRATRGSRARSARRPRRRNVADGETEYSSSTALAESVATQGLTRVRYEEVVLCELALWEECRAAAGAAGAADSLGAYARCALGAPSVAASRRSILHVGLYEAQLTRWLAFWSRRRAL